MLIACRRLIIMMAVAGLMVAGVIVASPGDAMACTLSDHCYAISQVLKSSNHGMFGTLYVHCLFSPSSSEFVNQEIWDVEASGSYWVEVGVKDGRDFNGVNRDQGWFWADSRPGGGYNEHFIDSHVSLDTDHDVQIERNGSAMWNVYGGNTFHQIGTSTSNPITMDFGQAGSEYTLNSGSGMRDTGVVGGLEYQDSSNNFHFWGTGGSTIRSGPGNWVFAGYDSGTSAITWSTPNCLT